MASIIDHGTDICNRVPAIASDSMLQVKKPATCPNAVDLRNSGICSALWHLPGKATQAVERRSPGNLHCRCTRQSRMSKWICSWGPESTVSGSAGGLHWVFRPSCEHRGFAGAILRLFSVGLVRMRGLEPPLPCENMDLNHARLPVPPHPHPVDADESIVANSPAQSQFAAPKFFTNGASFPFRARRMRCITFISISPRARRNSSSSRP
jgi:hypothetical protein